MDQFLPTFGPKVIAIIVIVLMGFVGFDHRRPLAQRVIKETEKAITLVFAGLAILVAIFGLPALQSAPSGTAQPSPTAIRANVSRTVLTPTVYDPGTGRLLPGLTPSAYDPGTGRLLTVEPE